MARKTIEQRLAELEAQGSALKALLSRLERANDTRRKMLIGTFILHHLETANDAEFDTQLRDWLRCELTLDNDKALFADLIG